MLGPSWTINATGAIVGLGVTVLLGWRSDTVTVSSLLSSNSCRAGEGVRNGPFQPLIQMISGKSHCRNTGLVTPHVYFSP